MTGVGQQARELLQRATWRRAAAGGGAGSRSSTPFSSARHGHRGNNRRRHPRARAHAPVPSPEWTARSPALGSAATRPRWPCSPSTPGSPSCGSIRWTRRDAGPGCCASPMPTGCPHPAVGPSSTGAARSRGSGSARPGRRRPRTAGRVGNRRAPAPAPPPAPVCPSTAPSPHRSPPCPRRSARPRPRAGRRQDRDRPRRRSQRVVAPRPTGRRLRARRRRPHAAARTRVRSRAPRLRRLTGSGRGYRRGCTRRGDRRRKRLALALDVGAVEGEAHLARPSSRARARRRWPRARCGRAARGSGRRSASRRGRRASSRARARPAAPGRRSDRVPVRSRPGPRPRARVPGRRHAAADAGRRCRATSPRAIARAWRWRCGGNSSTNRSMVSIAVTVDMAANTRCPISAAWSSAQAASVSSGARRAR